MPGLLRQGQGTSAYLPFTEDMSATPTFPASAPTPHPLPAPPRQRHPYLGENSSE